jgi:hypothetical protein
MVLEQSHELRDGVLFDCRNVMDTAKHCMARNEYLSGKTDGHQDAVAELLMAGALEVIAQSEFVPGQMFKVFNAWAVADEVKEGSQGTVGGIDIREARLQLNFFVRLGRQPRLAAVAGNAD